MLRRGHPLQHSFALSDNHRSLTRCVDSASSLKELLHWKQVVRGPFPHKRPDVHCNRRKVCAAHPKAPGLAFFASGPRPRLIIRIGSRLQPCYLIGLLLCMTLTSRMRAGSPDLSSIASGPHPSLVLRICSRLQPCSFFGLLLHTSSSVLQLAF